MNRKIAGLLLVAACNSRDGAASARQEAQAGDKAGRLDDGKMGKKDNSPHRGQYALAAGTAAPPPASAPVVAAKPMAAVDEIAANEPEKKKEEAKGGEGGTGASERGAATRSWFPETFLFQPLVVTDGGGLAKVAVKVPDRLTTWHVLALAHSRAGAQAGTVAKFLGTLPSYVDPVVPAFLLVGDEVRLPVQIVNTTEKPVSGELRVSAENATVALARMPVTVPAGGSVVEYTTLRTQKPGTATLKVSLGDTDAVLRTFPVLPAGRKVVQKKSGTLAAPRELSLEAPAGTDPASSEVRVMVFPGALGLLRTELAAAVGRPGLTEDAYTLYLAGHAAQLLAAFGDKPDPDAIRELSIVAGQRALHHGRNLDVTAATVLGPAALAHPDNPVLARLGERAESWLAMHQRPDGTFSGGDGWTLQRLLVATADGVRATQAGAVSQAGKQRALAVSLKAGGAFERNLERVQDGYTAAAILSSGAVSGELADKLLARVRADVKKTDDGARALAVAEGTVRADGSIPSEVEATALAVLALSAAPKAEDKEILADLGTTLLSGYGYGPGWGDGQTNLVCLQAVLALFKDPIPPGVKVALTVDGKAVADGVLDRERLREVLVLAGPAPAAGAHAFRLVADPPVAGLGFAMALTSYVPWDKQEPRGLELSIAAPTGAQAGKPIEVVIHAAAPAGKPLHIVQALPAGVVPDSASLDKLVSAGTLTSWHGSDGSVELETPELEEGQTFSAAYRVVPTLGGTLHAGASRIETASLEGTYYVPPLTWSVK